MGYLEMHLISKYMGIIHIFLLLLSCLILLWSENMLISLLKVCLFVLWPKIWSILMNVPYAHERNVYFETYLMFYKCQLNQAG